MNQAPIAPAAGAPSGRFLSMKDVVDDSGLSKPTINRMHRRGEFPAKVTLSPGRKGWWESEYLAWKTLRERVSS
jgi:prophage regulatory protein